MSAAFRDETWNPGRHHRVEPASDLNPVDLVNGSFWNLRDVVILSRPIQGFRGGKDSRSTLDQPFNEPHASAARDITLTVENRFAGKNCQRSVSTR
jgi:hypothetical protein